MRRQELIFVLFVFAPAFCSVEQVFERYDLQTSIYRSQHQSEELQHERDTYNLKRKELADKTLELRRLNGEELQGLKIQELQKLEKLLGKGLARVSKEKDERIQKDISELKKKGVELVQHNQRLKQMRNHANNEGQPSKSTMIRSDPSNRAQDSDNHDDASLNLGLAMLK